MIGAGLCPAAPRPSWLVGLKGIKMTAQGDLCRVDLVLFDLTPRRLDVNTQLTTFLDPSSWSRDLKSWAHFLLRLAALFTSFIKYQGCQVILISMVLRNETTHFGTRAIFAVPFPSRSFLPFSNSRPSSSLPLSCLSGLTGFRARSGEIYKAGKWFSIILNL